MGGLEDPTPRIPNDLSPYYRLSRHISEMWDAMCAEFMKDFSITYEELGFLIAKDYADFVRSGPIPDPSGLATIANDADVNVRESGRHDEDTSVGTDRLAAYARLIRLYKTLDPAKRFSCSVNMPIQGTQLIHLGPVASQQSSLVFNGINSVTGTLSSYKILLPSDDGYRDYRTLENRQRELRGALHWSRVFNGETRYTGSFHGLCPVVSMVVDDSRRALTMNVGPMTIHPSGDMYWGLEYALSTRFFHPDSFLDQIATKPSVHNALYSRKVAMAATVDALIEMDRERAAQLSASSVERYGSVQHIHAKTRGNVAFLVRQLSDVPASDGLHEILDPQTIAELVQVTESVFNERGPYTQWFAERARLDQNGRNHNIKHCHGDVTTTNTVVDSVTRRIFFLDPVVGLPDMYNIDVISNAAMILTDWQARTGDYQWEKIYMRKIERLGDPCAEAVMAFYLLDKAVVKTGIAIGDQDSLLASAFALEVVRCMSKVRGKIARRPTDDH